MLTIHTRDRVPMKVAALCSQRAPGLLHLLSDQPERGLSYEVVCCVTSEPTFSEGQAVERLGVPVVRHSIADFYAARGASLYRDAEVRAAFDWQTVGHLVRYSPDLLLLDGYRYLVTEPLLSAFRGRIVNLHFSDLSVRRSDGGPLFPGLRAVRDTLAAGCRETRATVHVVDTEPDGGPPIVRSWPFPVSPMFHAGAAGTDMGKAYTFAHQQWMMRDGAGPLLAAAVQLIARHDVDLHALAACAPADVAPWDLAENGTLTPPAALVEAARVVEPALAMQ
jgi:folate-dependent phosphoribosylglycinamide formyltransferase PurN